MGSTSSTDISNKPQLLQALYTSNNSIGSSSLLAASSATITSTHPSVSSDDGNPIKLTLKSYEPHPKVKRLAKKQINLQKKIKKVRAKK